MKNLVRAFLMPLVGAVLLSSVASAQTTPVPPPVAAPRLEYVLGAGDVVRISVYQNPDLSLETRVSEAGVINFPLLGSVRLGGLSASQAEKRLADGLRNGNFVKQPQVSVLITQVRGSQVSALGWVSRAGRFPLETADVKLTDVLAQAGGVAPGGAETVTLVGTRNQAPFRLEIDLPSLFGASRGDDPILQNGDVIWVDRAPVVYIYGEVQRPGPIRIERGMTMMQALATGGGLTQRGTEKGIRVHRRGADGKVAVLTPAMDDTVRDGDVVYVRESLF
jgi:polysaccharide export outer membrane protein